MPWSFLLPGKFLSTPSARRATHRLRRCSWQWRISIHALREEGDHFHKVRDGLIVISIHALREEGDLGRQQLYPDLLPISIHALREEGDTKPQPQPTAGGQFLSTPSARRATTTTSPQCS